MTRNPIHMMYIVVLNTENIYFETKIIPFIVRFRRTFCRGIRRFIDLISRFFTITLICHIFKIGVFEI